MPERQDLRGRSSDLVVDVVPDAREVDVVELSLEIKAKLGVRTDIELTRVALKLGLIWDVSASRSSSWSARLLRLIKLHQRLKGNRSERIECVIEDVVEHFVVTRPDAEANDDVLFSAPFPMGLLAGG